MAAAATHLDEDSISRFLEGSLPTPDRERLRLHAEDCPTCRNVLAAVKSADPEGTMVDEGESLLISIDTADSGPPSQPIADLVGTQVGEYITEEVLGSGGMGIVYKARHPLIGKTVAIKVLRPELASEPGHMQNLLAEARAASQVSHRTIVDIFSFGSLPDGRQYLVMEYLVGKPLNRIVKEEAPLPVWEVLAYLDAVAAALEAAHEAEIVHRDLKPSNLFIQRERDGAVHVKLLDFGLARAASPISSDANPSSNLLLGTPAYMSPEQVRGEPADARADLYALGVIGYELAVGKRPFRGDNMFRLMTAHLEDAPPPPTSLRPDLPKEIEALILRMLSKPREARIQSATALRYELKALRRTYHAPGETHARLQPVTQPPTRVEPPAAKRPTWLLAAFAAVALAAVAAGWFGLRARRAAEEQAQPPVVVASPTAVVAPVPPPPPPVVAAATPPDVPDTAPELAPPPMDKALKKPAAARPPSLTSRADKLKRRLLAATAKGSEPDPMALMLIGEARSAAAKARSDKDQAKVEKMLSDIERNYLGGR